MASNDGIQPHNDEHGTTGGELMTHGHHSRERINQMRHIDKQIVRDERMKEDWLLLTGENMDSRDLERLKTNWTYLNETIMDPNDFERLINNWTLLAKADPKYLEHSTRDMRADDFENLKRDYLVLNWTNMSLEDFEQFKKNWLIISGGTAEEDNIVKLWLFKYVPFMEYRNMSNEEKYEFTRRCLERGADVNAVNGSGYSLLHRMVSYIHPPLIELLLSYGADVTLRQPTGETPLEIVRTYYYKHHEDVVSMLQTAEKSARNNSRLNSEGSLMREGISENQLGRSKRRNKIEIENWWIETSESPYLTRASKLFDLEDADIDNLMLLVINYMYVSKIQKTELKFNQPFDRYKKIMKIHQVFSKMCSKLFNIFDPQFNQSINIEFRRDTKLSESAELVFLLEIHPEVEWVVLKIYAVPWDIEYYVYCKASSKSGFALGRHHQNSSSICYSNLLCEYKK